MENIEQISCEEFINCIEKNDNEIFVIDCRSFTEFNISRIKNSIHLFLPKIIQRRIQTNNKYLNDYESLLLNNKKPDIIIFYDKNNLHIKKEYDIIFDYFNRKYNCFKLISTFENIKNLKPEICEIDPHYNDNIEVYDILRIPLLSNILPYLILGTEDCLKKELFKENNIKYVINVSKNILQPNFIDDTHFKRIPVNDTPNDSLIEYFDEIYNFIENIEPNSKVLVHCSSGISRSPTIVLSYLMKKYGLSANTAYDFLKSKRSCVNPNLCFFGQLKRYEESLYTNL